MSVRNAYTLIDFGDFLAESKGKGDPYIQFLSTTGLSDGGFKFAFPFIEYRPIHASQDILNLFVFVWGAMTPRPTEHLQVRITTIRPLQAARGRSIISWLVSSSVLHSSSSLASSFSTRFAKQEIARPRTTLLVIRQTHPRMLRGCNSTTTPTPSTIRTSKISTRHQTSSTTSSLLSTAKAPLQISIQIPGIIDTSTSRLAIKYLTSM